MRTPSRGEGVEKIDLRKELKRYYTAGKKPEVIDVPPGKFLSIFGRGEPAGDIYCSGLEALYSMSYALKFSCKKQGKDFTVMTLEGLWWWDDLTAFDLQQAPPRSEWNFKSMIRQPDFVTQKMVDDVRPGVRDKKGSIVDEVILETFHEGLSAQVMHIGPYSEEGPTVKVLHDFIRGSGYKVRGRHHEIYLGDPRTSAPSKLKTIIRQPVERA